MDAEKEAFLTITLNSLPVLVSFVDRSLIYRYVNKTYEKFFNTVSDSVIGKSVQELLGQEAYEILLPYIESALKGEVQKFENRIPYNIAGERFVEVTYIPSKCDQEINGFYAIINDITDLVKSKQEIQDKENEVSRLLNSIPAMIGHWNRNLINLNANATYSYFFGKTPEEIKGKHLKNLLGPKLFEKNYPYIQAVLEGKVQTFEGEIHLPQGGSRHTIAQYLPEISDGEVVGFYSVVSDVTALKISEEKYKGFLESAFDAIVLTDEKFVIQFVNKQVLNWFGYTLTELIGRPIEILIPERFREVHVKQRNEYAVHPVPRGMGRNLDLWGRRKDGSEFSVDISISPVHTENGLSISAVIRDISDKKLIENQQNFLLKTNEILSETMDYQERLQRIANIIVPELADWCAVSILEDDQLKLKAIAPHPTEIKPNFSLESSDSELNQKKFISLPLTARGKWIGTITMTMSESGRVFSRDELIFAQLVAIRCAMSADNARLFQEAQNAISVREDVVTIVSHDLKNPLSSILLSAHSMEKQKPEGITEEDWGKLQKKINIIKNSTNRAITLINNFLDLSKIESGTLQLEKANTDAIAMTSSIVNMLKLLATEKGVQLRLDFSNPHLSITCDENKISQVLSNLIGNSLKFTPKGGNIDVKVTSDENFLYFSIHDTGKGISSNDLPHIFDRFWQATDTQKLGNGLGLSIAKAIVKAHNGKIWVESELGLGSTFHFALPH